MNLLLDTHAFLWFIGGDNNLSAAARQTIEDTHNTASVSVASLWEMGIKMSLGRLHLQEPFGTLIPSQIQQNGFDLLPIRIAEIDRVISLPFHHRDPFDRILAAQCLVGSLTIISRDTAFDLYGVPRVW